MELTTILTLSSTAVALVIAILLVSAIRTRRHKERLVAMGRRHAMALVQGDLHGESFRHAARFASKRRKVRLQDVLVGEDDEGRFHLAHRSMGRTRHHVLFCQITSQTNVEGFHVVPQADPDATAKTGLFRRGPRIDPGGDWHLDLRWTTPRSSWVNGQSIGVGARVLGHTARLGEEKHAIPVGVEIHHRNLLVHSMQPLSGRQLDRFVDDSIKLRRQILHALRTVQEKTAERPRSAPSQAPMQAEDLVVQVLH